MQHVDLKPEVVPIPPAPVLDKALTTLPAEGPTGAVITTVPPDEERPIPVTELIFAPRKKEMNKGFLMFSPDEGLTSKTFFIRSYELAICKRFLYYNGLYFSVLKDEPEDLTSC
jgi:hypothetical protein